MDLAEVIKKLHELEANIEQYSQSELDRFVETNAEKALQSGISAVLIRRQMGHCCDWCANIAGVYDYGRGRYPEDIFKRHRFCKCIVTVKHEKGGYHEVWSKKTYRTQAEARKERLEAVRKEYAAAAAEDRKKWQQRVTAQREHAAAFEKAKRAAREEGKLFFDSTEFYTNLPPTDPGKAVDCPYYFTHRGVELKIDGDQAEFHPTVEERMTADWIAERFGYQVTRMPKINKPPELKCGDYLVNGSVLFDLKEPEGGTKNTIQNQVNGHRGQAEVFVISIAKTPLTKERVFADVERIMRDYRKDWIKEIWVIDGKVGNYSLLKTYTRV